MVGIGGIENEKIASFPVLFKPSAPSRGRRSDQQRARHGSIVHRWLVVGGLWLEVCGGRTRMLRRHVGLQILRTRVMGSGQAATGTVRLPSNHKPQTTNHAGG